MNKGGQRTALIKKNILGSLMTKGLSIAVSLLFIPITLNYLDETRYGIWMTLTSVVAWISIFDIGLGNGLRNKLAECLAVNDMKKAKQYVSTAYVSLGVISLIILLIFAISNIFIDWTIILNTKASYLDELFVLTYVVFIFFILRFVLNLISIIYTAYQYPAYSSLLELLGSLLTLAGIYILTFTNYTSLFAFGLIAMSLPVLVYLVASVYSFSGWLKIIRPSISHFNSAMVREIFGLGIQFFIIQIAVIVIFQSSNILITQFFDPAEVTPYNIAFKYFSISTMIFGIVMTPLWSSFTDAYTKKDVVWIYSTLRKLNYSILGALFLICTMSFLAKDLIALWTGGKISVSNGMIIAFAIFCLISIWNNIYSYFLNGVSITRAQIITAVCGALLHIPLSWFMIKKFGLGSEGVAYSMAISLAIFAIVGPLQTYNFLRKWKMSL